MSRLPRISGRTLCKVLEHHGFILARQKGSHMMMRCATPPHITVSVPDHKELAPGTLRSLLHDIGMAIDELNKLLPQIRDWAVDALAAMTKYDAMSGQV